MLKNLNKRKKKKGFTLIELVIVLAVLAIIALIAIPNFTKIRTKSIIDADYRAAEQIEKIALMGIANGDIASTITTFTVGDNGTIAEDTTKKYEPLFREANGPQVPMPTGVTKVFRVNINTTTGAVSVGYNTTGTGGAAAPQVEFNGKLLGPVLAGEGAKQPIDKPAQGSNN